jgi:methylated-DNA-[protein]-cysteine S-methyltransferase
MNNKNEPIYTRKYKSKFGLLHMGSFQDKLCLCDWYYRNKRESIDLRIQNYLQTNYEEGNSSVIEKAINELEEYFNKQRKIFTIPLLLAGSEFQIKVWEELKKINFGSTISYLNLSKNLGNTKAIRAVASANGANSISILIPCHRIIGTKGELVGYAGGLEVKKRLLNLEQDFELDLFS